MALKKFGRVGSNSYVCSRTISLFLSLFSSTLLILGAFKFLSLSAVQCFLIVSFARREEENFGGKRAAARPSKMFTMAACCPFDSLAGLFSTAESIHIWPQPDFFSIFIFISGGDQKLLFPSYSPLLNSLLCRKSPR